MDKGVFKNLKIGERIIDIKEFYIGKNGQNLTYEVTLYTCKSFLFKKYISKYVFPFYFANKDVINDFFKQYDRFKITSDLLYCHDFKIILNDIKKPHYRFYLCNTHNSVYEWSLSKGEIWAGKIVGFYDDGGVNSTYKEYINIDELYKLENEASKENTYGKSQIYKLTEV